MKVVVITSSPAGMVTRCVEALLASERIELVGLVIAGQRRQSATRRANRKLRKMLRIGIFGALNGLRLRAWYAEQPTEDVRMLCANAGVSCIESPCVDANPVHEFLRRLQPDLGCSVNNGYIPHSIFSLPRFGMINVHGELLPGYQNAQSVIWPIHNHERMTGFTIHQIDKRIDTGPILYQEELPIDFGATLRETVVRTLPRVRERVPKALREVCENYEALSGSAIRQTGGRSYTTPSIAAFIRMIVNNRRMSAGGRTR